MSAFLTDARQRQAVANVMVTNSRSRSAKTGVSTAASRGGDGAASILDIVAAAADFTEAVPPAPERNDQDGDAQISILDLT